jgi:hypothetical protein
MPIQFRCPCGAILHANETHVDAIKPCPNCQANLRIPHAPLPGRECVMCKRTIPHGHTIWVRGRRLCWKCLPPQALLMDRAAIEEHRRLQIETLRKAKVQGLHYFQYHAPYGSKHDELQATADEAVFEEKDWDKVTSAWRELGLIPFDMGSFMGVSLNIERFHAQAEDSKALLEPLLKLVKLADELPLASVPKDPSQASSLLPSHLLPPKA